ncbi:PaaX family transcriptional regulator C-terminal domain-containing protein [Micromonospora sp. NPDC006766]|uniref:PaaX family transcriptional regulator n=1 Tax=Micromonospora sp. NPDC006766 TaxID=3154778 RepID=UPI0033F6FBB7
MPTALATWASAGTMGSPRIIMDLPMSSAFPSNLEHRSVSVVIPYEMEDIVPELAGSVRLPRRQAGTSPQGMAMTLIADYTARTRAWLPSASIVALLAETGVSTAGARTAISRLARRGALENCREGRHSSYRLTRAAAAELMSGGAWIAGFASGVDSWDGCWTLVAFSLPQEASGHRRALRDQLRWLGFASLFDGLWVSPDALNPTVENGLRAFGIGAMSIFRASHVDLASTNSRSPIEAWDVAAIAEQYETFIQRWKPLLPRIRAGRITGAQAVATRTEVMDTYRRFPILDPQLPLQLMPPGWPRVRARELFVSVYDGLAEPAQEHVRAVVARFADSPDPGILAHTTRDLSTSADTG